MSVSASGEEAGCRHDASWCPRLWMNRLRCNCRVMAPILGLCLRCARPYLFFAFAEELISCRIAQPRLVRNMTGVAAALRRCAALGLRAADVSGVREATRALVA